MPLNDRIREAIETSKKTKAEIARETGTTGGAVTQWLDGTTKSLKATTAAALGRATGYSASWLATGKGPKLISAENVEPGPASRGDVPLISWVAASDWCEAGDPFPPGAAEEWLPCPAHHSSHTFALRVRGDSMTAPHGNSRTYPEGCVIFVDPERRSPVNGDRIVACLEGAHEVTFKVYKNEDGRQWLAPLNPSHEPIREPFRVLGTIIGKWEAE